MLYFFLLSDTYTPRILVREAAGLRRKARNRGIHAEHEEVEVNFHDFLAKYFGPLLHMPLLSPSSFASLCTGQRCSVL
ncbi:hypothetical protein B0O99DRAFT_712619 [Bisporella sp. PMI_857]|nr:hypothetical protein B0O99DRAFT_712619 [Bisporella sp. PMI_857]